MKQVRLLVRRRHGRRRRQDERRPWRQRRRAWRRCAARACPCLRASPFPPTSAISTSRTRTTSRRKSTSRSARRSRSWKSRWARSWATPTDPLLLSVRSGAKFSMPGMMNTILNLGLNDATTEGAGEAKTRQSALRLRLLSPLHSDVRRSGAGYRHGQVRPHLRRAQAQGEGQARYRSDGRRSEGHHRRLQEAGPERNQQAVSAGRARAARDVARRGVPLLVERRRPPTTARWKRSPTTSAPPPTCRPWCSATWATLRHRRRLHARSRLPARRCSTANSW